MDAEPVPVTADEVAAGIAAGQLLLAYQPIVDARSHQLRGAEALVRWAHPGRGLLLPADFLPQVEASPVIERLTRATVLAAFDQMVAWRAAGRTLGVSINISARVVGDLAEVRRIARGLAARDLPPELVTLEITESALLGHPAAAEVIAAARALGCRVSLDDFGTGFATLSRLRDFRFDEIKIDRTFVRDLCTSVEDQAVVRSVLELGHRLGLDVVAEGVEDAATARLLAELGCDLLQGYHFGRPGPPSELPADPPAPERRVRSWPAGPDEPARQAAVEEIELPADDPSLADIAALARDLLGARSALLTLVDGDRQRLLAEVNFAGGTMPRGDSFCAHVVAADERLEVPDATADERFADLWYVAGPPYIRSYAGVPLTTETGHAVGSLCVLDTRPRTLTAAERGSLDRLGRLAAARVASLQRAGLLRRLTAALTTLGGLSRSADLPPAVQTSLRAACDLLDGDGALMLLADVAGGVRMRALGAVRGGEPLELAGLEVDVRRSPLLEQLVAERVPVFRAASAPASDVERLWGEQLGVGASLTIPVLGGGTVNGAVLVWWSGERRVLPGAWRGVAQMVADVAGATVSRLQALEDLRVTADTDALTGLLNRRGFLRRAAGLEPGGALLIADLDKFKDVNDERGHQVGDEALVAYGGLLSGSLRRDDVAARWGGEEFVVAAPGVGVEGAGQLLARLRERWAAERALPLTYSAGCVVLGLGEGIEAALRRADAALYAAKSAGRDRDVLA